MDYIGDLNARLVDEFLEKWNHIPVFDGPVDTDIRAYCVMLAEWVRGNDSWSFEVRTVTHSSTHFLTPCRAGGISGTKDVKYRPRDLFV